MGKYIIDKNNTGKTRKMLEEAKKTGAVVVCKNPYAMKIKANNYGIFGIDFIKYDEINTYPIYGKNIAIDELCDFFKYYYGVELDSFTMTVEW